MTLCIGGPLDGMLVPEETPYFTVPITTPLNLKVRDDSPSGRVEIARFEYIRSIWRADEKTDFLFYAPKKMGPRDIMQALVDTYANRRSK